MGLFDDIKAAPKGGGLFDDIPASGGAAGLFDDIPHESAPEPVYDPATGTRIDSNPEGIEGGGLLGRIGGAGRRGAVEAFGPGSVYISPNDERLAPQHRLTSGSYDAEGVGGGGAHGQGVGGANASSAEPSQETSDRGDPSALWRIASTVGRDLQIAADTFNRGFGALIQGGTSAFKQALIEGGVSETKADMAEREINLYAQSLLPEAPHIITRGAVRKEGRGFNRARDATDELADRVAAAQPGFTDVQPETVAALPSPRDLLPPPTGGAAPVPPSAPSGGGAAVARNPMIPQGTRQILTEAGFQPEVIEAMSPMEAFNAVKGLPAKGGAEALPAEPALTSGAGPRDAKTSVALPHQQEASTPLAPNTIIGLRFPNAPSRRAEVVGVFDNGESVRLQFDDGQQVDYLTSEVQRDRVEAPPPRNEVPPPVVSGKPVGESESFNLMREAALAEPPAPRATGTAPLAPALLGQIDQANALEHRAVTDTSLTSNQRQDMLAAAIRLRRQAGADTEPTEFTPDEIARSTAQREAGRLGELGAAEPTMAPPGEEPAPSPVPPRASVPVLPETTKSAPRPMDLAQFLVANGGVKDETGDLRGIDAHLWHREVPFRKRLVRDDGMSVDQARELAAEAGYLPPDEPGAPPQSTRDDLYQALGETIRGNPIFSSRDQTAVDQWQHGLAESRERGRQAAGYDYDSVFDHEDAMVEAAERAALQADHGASAELTADEWQRELDGWLLADRPEIAEPMAEKGVDLGRGHEAEQGSSAGAEGSGADAAIREEPQVAPEAAAGPAGDHPVAAEGATQGRPVEKTDQGLQTIMPGMERSARQAAASREAAGRGKATSKAQQQPADHGLFARPAETPASLPGIGTVAEATVPSMPAVPSRAVANPEMPSAAKRNRGTSENPVKVEPEPAAPAPEATRSPAVPPTATGPGTKLARREWPLIKIADDVTPEMRDFLTKRNDLIAWVNGLSDTEWDALRERFGSSGQHEAGWGFPGMLGGTLEPERVGAEWRRSLAENPPVAKPRSKIDRIADLEADRSAEARGERTAGSPAQSFSAIAETPKETAPATETVPYTLDHHGAMAKRIASGDITAAELKDNFRRLVASEAAIKTELGTKTLKQLAPGGTGGLTKAQVIGRIFDNMQTRYAIGDSLSWSPMEEKFQDAVRRRVEAVTDEEIQARAQKRRDARSVIANAIADPKTLGDFHVFIDAKGEAALTPEMRARYDELLAEDTRRRAERAEAQKAVVKAVPIGDVTMTVVPTKHTRTGEPLWAVQLSEKVQPEQYKELLGRAKQLGGWYSSFRGNGAVPGFQFKNEEAANSFTALKDRDVSRAPAVAERHEEKRQGAVERLRDMAARMGEKADEELGRDRKQNTARRAGMAASAEARANADKALAATMQNLAEAIESGVARNLGGIRTKADVETLDRLLKRAQYKAMNALPYPERVKQEGRPPSVSDVEEAKYPLPNAHHEALLDVARAAADLPGAKLAARRMIKAAQDVQRRNEWLVEFDHLGNQDDARTISEAVQKAVPNSTAAHSASMILDTFGDEQRLKRMGLVDLPMLRAALREYLDYRGTAAKADRVKALERDLVGAKIPGFFPTPKPVVDRMIEEAQIRPGERVLEPSAGKGDIADAVREAEPGADLQVNEPVGRLADLLEAKGYRPSQVTRSDFLSMAPVEQFDKVVMNPPFENGQDAAHVRHAYDLLKPGGRVVAIMSESPFFRQDAAAKEFREWLDERGGVSEKLPEGSFKSSFRPTGVATRLVTIDKPSRGHLSEEPTPAPREGADLAPGSHRDMREDFLRHAAERLGADDPIARNIHAARYVMDRGNETGHEYLVAFDGVGREIVDASTNDHPVAVGFSGRLLHTLEHGRDQLVIHHNHPTSHGLSMQDQRMLAYPGLHAIVAHGHDGEISGAVLTPRLRQVFDHLTTEHAGQVMSDLIEAANQGIQAVIRPKIKNRLIDYEVANQLHAELVSRALDASGVIDYVGSRDLSRLRDPDYLQAVQAAMRSVNRRALDLGVPIEEKKGALVDRPSAIVRPTRTEGMARLLGGIGEASRQGRAVQPGDGGVGAPAGGAPGAGVAEEEAYQGQIANAAEEASRRAGFAKDPTNPALRSQKVAFHYGFSNAVLKRPRGDLTSTADEAHRRAYDRGEVAGRAWADHTGVDQIKRQTNLAEERGPYPEQPSVAQAESDKIDDVAQRAGEALKGAPPGTYERTLNRMTPDPGASLPKKNLGAFEKFVIMPRTLAATDWRSARYLEQWRRRDAKMGQLIHRWSDASQDYYALKPEQRRAMNAVKELDRLDQRTRADDGRSIMARNDGHEDAELSRPGERIVLDPATTRAYHQETELMRDAWSEIMHGTSQKLGGDGEIDPAVLRAKANAITEASLKRRLGHIADLMEAMDGQRRVGYSPLMRFGDYFIAVKHREGTEPDSMGGFPKVARFELVDSKTPFESLFGQNAREGETPNTVVDKVRGARNAVLNAPSALRHIATVRGRLAELREKYPADRFTIEHGFLVRKADELRNLDVPAIEKLFMALQQRDSEVFGPMVEQLRAQMYEEMKAGFKRKAKTVPGYSPDFDRARGSYLGWVANHVADLQHGEDIRRAQEQYVDRHPDKRVQQYWQKWADYQKSPAEEMAKLRQFGFYWQMAMNPSSTLLVATHGPMVGLATLSTGVGGAKAGRHLLGAAKEALAAVRFDTKVGAHVDMSRIGRTPAERALVKSAIETGQLHASGAQDIRGFAQGDLEALRPHLHAWGRTLDILSSNITVADQVNRAAMLVGAHRLASSPGAMEAMIAAWHDNQVLQNMLRTDGRTPETLAKFMVDEGLFVWGKRNRMPAARGMGAVLMQFRNFEVNYISSLWKMMTRMGPDGRRAGLLMLAGLAALGGISALPGEEDAEKVLAAAYALLTRKHPMIADQMREMLEDVGFSKLGAEMVMKGPSRAMLGIDLSSRLGFGDLASKNLSPVEALGVVPSMIYGAAQRFWNRAHHNQPLGAASELMPTAAKNAFKGAVVYPREGVRTQYDTMVVPPAQITTGDRVAKGLGFQSATEARKYEHSQRAKQMRDDELNQKRDLTDQAVGLEERLEAARSSGDHVEEARTAEALTKLFTDHPDIKVSSASVRRLMLQHKNPEGALQRSMPKDLRQKVQESPLVQP